MNGHSIQQTIITFVCALNVKKLVQIYAMHTVDIINIIGTSIYIIICLYAFEFIQSNNKIMYIYTRECECVSFE